MAAESDLEKWCREYAEERSCWLPKWVSPGNRGVQDRILLVPRRVVFLEFKAPRGALSAQQRIWKQRMRDLEIPHGTIKSREEFISVFEATPR